MIPEREENPVLIAVATTIADGHPVDWESLVAEHPEMAEELRSLQVIEEIERARLKAELEGRRR